MIETTQLGTLAVRIAIKRGYVNFHLAARSGIEAAVHEGWLRKDRRCRTPTYRVTPEGRAAFPDVEPSGGPVAKRTRNGW